MTTCNFDFDTETGNLILVPACFGTVNRGIEGCTCDIDLEAHMKIMIRLLVDSGEVEQSKKCCGKCAFRKNSPERCDPYEWVKLSESLSQGLPFVCHEGLPEHQHYIGARLKLCAGWKAMQGQPLETWASLAYTDGRQPDVRFE